jgi:hypothetical protein
MRPARALLGLLFVMLAGQSCVLEPLEANRTAEAGNGGNGSAGSPTSAGGKPAGGAGTVNSAGSSQGGASAGAGVTLEGGAGAGGGLSGGSGATNSGGAGEGGSGDVPPVDWVRCDPTFAYNANPDCPSLQPLEGTACNDDIFYYPEDFCAYCQSPQACPVETQYVALQCVNRAWRMREVFGAGCCPELRPTHGTACDSTAYCEYGSFENTCECIEGNWNCCADVFDGDACTEPGDQCLLSFGPVEADRCICNGATAADALWSCCPYFAPIDGDSCYYDQDVTCAYPDQTCTCAFTASIWSCN